MKTPPRVPGKRVVYIGGRPVVLSDADYRKLVDAFTGKKRAKKGKQQENK